MIVYFPSQADFYIDFCSFARPQESGKYKYGENLMAISLHFNEEGCVLESKKPFSTTVGKSLLRRIYDLSEKQKVPVFLGRSRVRLKDNHPLLV